MTKATPSRSDTPQPGDKVKLTCCSIDDLRNFAAYIDHLRTLVGRHRWNAEQLIGKFVQEYNHCARKVAAARRHLEEAKERGSKRALQYLESTLKHEKAKLADVSRKLEKCTKRRDEHYHREAWVGEVGLEISRRFMSLGGLSAAPSCLPLRIIILRKDHSWLMTNCEHHEALARLLIR
jgi:Zn-dependent M16 (insulinase) family peptidase